MAQALTIQELDRIRERERPAREKAARERQNNPPRPEKEALLFIEFGRYVGSGDGVGLFYAREWVLDSKGKMKPGKILADGVDTFICGNEARAALDRTLNKRGK